LRDLTSGSITRHLLGMSTFIGLGLLVQTLYFLVDLYFVARLGEHAIAGVGAAGNAYTLSLAFGQLISIGGLSLIARSLGARDTEDAGLVFNQAVGLSVAAGLLSLVVGYTLGPKAMQGLGADAATAQAGRDYLFAFLPALALMFPAAAISSGLRAAGVVGPPMIIQSAALGLNVLLAPILISGWLTGAPMGVAGAGLASSIASAVGVGGILLLLFLKMPPHLRLDGRLFRPKLKVWGRIAGIGLPAAGEFFLMFVVMSVIYWVIRDFGPAAQAGFGIGSRVMQAIFLPAMALAFAAAPIAGQNFGARDAHRVRATFRQAALLGAGLMAVLTVLCQLRPELLIAPSPAIRRSWRWREATCVLSPGTLSPSAWCSPAPACSRRWGTPVRP
jgi:putative MATE family efflux protein